MHTAPPQLIPGTCPTQSERSCSAEHLQRVSSPHVDDQVITHYLGQDQLLVIDEPDSGNSLTTNDENREGSSGDAYG